MTKWRTRKGTEGVAWGTVSAGGQQRENQRSKERGRRAEKTKLLRGSADVGGPGLVWRETQKRLAADHSREQAETRRPTGLTFPAQVASGLGESMLGEWRRETPGPKVLVTNDNDSLTFPIPRQWWSPWSQIPQTRAAGSERKERDWAPGRWRGGANLNSGRDREGPNPSPHCRPPSWGAPRRALGLPGRRAGGRGDGGGERRAESRRRRGGGGPSAQPRPRSPARKNLLRLKSFDFSFLMLFVPEKEEFTLPSSPCSLADLIQFKIFL